VRVAEGVFDSHQLVEISRRRLRVGALLEFKDKKILVGVPMMDDDVGKDSLSIDIIESDRLGVAESSSGHRGCGCTRSPRPTLESWTAGLPVVGLAAVGVEPVGKARDVAQ